MAGAANAECFGGMCTDHVRCQSASCGACNSCNVAGKVGPCAPVAAGAADPAGSCKVNGSTSCGTTGVCDGAGHCANYAAGVGASKCDGSGHCVAGSNVDCSPRACVTGACTVGCTSASDCAPGYTCKAVVDAGVSAMRCM